ncbi:hypothetical protein Meth11DRAFT_1391 [Methylophilaceae bacterium 11]|nr:hypothetical protein Meth11DRAFT_1391 [Methylophilaceae bacterium 11]
MTTIAIWKVNAIESHLGNPAIWVISDSRASRTTNETTSTLTDKCAKLIEIECRVSINGEIIRSSILMAVAGNTLVAHNTIFSAQMALQHLMGPRLPTLLEVTHYVRDVLLNITKDVGLTFGKGAECEVLLIASDPISPKAYSLKPSYVPTIDYLVTEVLDFPYVTGSDKSQYLAAIEEMMKEERLSSNNQELLDQVPIRAFDQLFVKNKVSQKTGGELQIGAVGNMGVRRYMPMRWNESTNLYEFYMLGMDTWSKKIGACTIGIWPWQLEDIQTELA